MAVGFTSRERENITKALLEAAGRHAAMEGMKKTSVDELCANLWPKKENARETLYTLVRRLRPILERHSNLRLVAEKGGYYALSIQSADSQ